MRHDQHDRPTIDARAPAPQHTCCHHISLPTATRSRCLPSSLPRRRACPAPNALGDTSFMTAPPRAAATPYTRPAPPHWQSVDLAPHSRCARHTWTHCHPDSVPRRGGGRSHRPSEIRLSLQRATARAGEKGPDRCRTQHRGGARDAVRWCRRAPDADAGPPGKAAPTRPAPADGASSAPPNCERRRSARHQAADCSPPKSTTCIPLSIGGDRWDWANLGSPVTSITPPRTSSTASAAEPDHDDGYRGLESLAIAQARQRRGGRACTVPVLKSVFGDNH